MGIRKWFNKNGEAIVGVEILAVLVLLPTVIILQGFYAENIIDKSLWFFVGAGFSIPLWLEIIRWFKALGGKG